MNIPIRRLVVAAVLLAPLAAAASPVRLSVALDTPVILAAPRQHAYVRVALTGPSESGSRRTPVNLAIVLDRSGSMAGDKLEQAKRAALLALSHLGADDIVSVVAYDDSVEVLAPATKLTERPAVEGAIRRLRAGGSTALFAGVAKGAAEVRKFLSDARVNRVILLSDGIANVGPSSPGELGSLGASLSAEGISVTTIGLGLDYNETLMSRLAEESDGNHFFAERAADLERVFQTELGEVLSVCAQDVDVTITFAPSVRPVRVLGRDAAIHGQRVTGHLTQLYALQTKYLMIEVEAPEGRAGQDLPVADVVVDYQDLAARRRAQLDASCRARYTATAADVEAGRDARVTAAVARQIGAERTLQAMELRDRGQIDESRKLLEENAAYLRRNAQAYHNEYLEKDAKAAEDDAKNLEPSRWNRQRKQMEADTQEQTRALGYVEK